MKLILFLIAITSLLIGSTDSFALPYAQTSPPNERLGKLKGIILDQKGERVLATRITVESNKIKREEGYTEDGSYQLDLPAGIYFITFRADGFQPVRRKRIRVVAGSTRTLNITLTRLRNRQR